MKSLSRWVLLATTLGLAPISAVQADEALSRDAGCAVCHAVDGKLIGPSYKEIATRYAGDAGAASLLAERVRKGSSGVWGQLPMAPTPADRLSDADLARLVDWILAR
jgi:cytochrome c